MAAAKKVLVIDDDAAACGLIEEVLTRLGLEVQSSPDPRAGLEAAKEFIPDLIFINLLLSDTNGLKVSKAIHALKGLEKVPVIMLISHQGELDPKYTVTIGVLDTLVKPLKEAEIIAKTKAVLGDAAVSEAEDRTVREISLEEGIMPLILLGEGEMVEETDLASAMETPDVPIEVEHTKQGKKEMRSEMTKEGESRMPEKENPFDRKKDNDRNLFADESDIFGEELKKARAGGEKGLEKEGQEHDSFPEEDVDLSYEEEPPASPVRRILLIAASIVAGIALGVGGYLFFTAGNKHEPVEKQVVTVLPDSAAVPMPPAVPLEKPNVIPEIPVKAEAQKPETAQAKGAKSQEPLPKPEAKKEPVQKAEAERPKKETPPVAVAKSEEKKLLPLKQADKKEAPAAKKGKGAYYVQVGLFENKKNADTVAQKIKQKGFTPTIRKVANAQKKTLYRVTVGGYSSLKKALEVSEALGRQGVKAIVHKQ